MPLWLQKVRWWYEKRKAKLPGWALLLLGFFWKIFTGIPDVFDASQFWWKQMKNVSGVIGWVATVVNSIWFSIGLILAGIAWLRFVGESRRQLHHPIWPVLGWAVVIIVSLAFWSVLVAGYVASHLSEDLQQKVTSLERQIAPWGLTENQKRQLEAALKSNKVPPGFTYQLRVLVPDNCDRCAGYANDLTNAWQGIPGWEIRGTTIFGLDPRQSGILVPVDIEGCSSEELALMVAALDAAEIKYQKVRAEGNSGVDVCAIIVGNRPQG